MQKFFTNVCAASLLFLLLGAASQPASQPTAPAPDHSSPEKTWASICDALKAGDLERFRAGFYNSNIVSHLFMDAYSDVTVATFDLARATALLGEPGKQMGKKFEAVYTDLVQGGENRKSENDGGDHDKIRWVHAANPAKGQPDDVVYFKRVKGEWLIDTVETYELNTDSGRDAAEKLIDNVPKVTALLKQVSADIRAKKITTVEQMRQRLSAKQSP